MKLRFEEDLYVETNYRILYEDAFFFAIEKPAPLPVHSVGRFKEKNLLSLLKKDLGLPAAGLRLVNRIDSETSGIVIAAKDSGSAGKLGQIFEKRQIRKEYRAVVLGTPEKQEGTISVSLGTDNQRIHNIRVPDTLGQTAITDYKVLKVMGDYSLLQVLPQTGRTHQIRAHLAFMGHPVAGDKIYIDADIFERYIHEGWQEDMRPVVKASRLLLHASGLEFQHPETGRLMKFISEIPACFESASFI